MTIDSERWSAIHWTRSYLEAVAAGKPNRMYPIPDYVRIPAQVRIWARSLLKHYPEEHWIEQVREKYEGKA
jgi:hypothetical protein